MKTFLPILRLTVKVKKVAIAVVGNGSDGIFPFNIDSYGKNLIIFYLGFTPNL